jgi:hypothetical protein
VGEQGDVQLGQRHPGLDDGHMIGRVDLEDAVHPLEGDHYAPLDWRAPSRQPGARSACRQRYPFGTGRPDDSRHLRGRAWPHDGPGLDRCLTERLVVGGVLGDLRPEVDVGGPGDGHEQIVDHRGAAALRCLGPARRSGGCLGHGNSLVGRPDPKFYRPTSLGAHGRSRAVRHECCRTCDLITHRSGDPLKPWIDSI